MLLILNEVDNLLYHWLQLDFISYFRKHDYANHMYKMLKHGGFIILAMQNYWLAVAFSFHNFRKYFYAIHMYIKC